MIGGGAAAPPPEVAAASAAVKDGHIEDALQLLDRALEREPECAAAHVVRGMALLALGRFEEGFVAYEQRRRVPGFEGNAPPLPRWDGRSMPGGTLLLWDEQGYGDTIQFVRFAARAVDRSGARVALYAHPRLCRLLRGSPGLRVGVGPRPRAGAWPPAQAQLSIMSLPTVLGLGAEELEGTTPYLAAETALAAAWRTRIDTLATVTGRRPRVGLVWQGNLLHVDDRRRSIPLAALAPLVERFAGCVTFVALQVGPALQALAAARLPIVNLGGTLDRGPDAFIDTAAVISGLDLVIACDTAVAHLAGALGATVWVVLARPCDWRWGRDCARSPFYGTARLFRQPAPGDWDGALAAVATALEQRVR